MIYIAFAIYSLPFIGMWLLEYPPRWLCWLIDRIQKEPKR